MKEIKDDTNRWEKIYHVFGSGESILLKWLNYSRQIPMFQSIWKRIWLQLFQLWPWLVESWSLLSNFWLKCFSHLTSIISGAKPMGPSPRTTFVTSIAMSWPQHRLLDYAITDILRLLKPGKESSVILVAPPIFSQAYLAPIFSMLGIPRTPKKQVTSRMSF